MYERHSPTNSFWQLFVKCGVVPWETCRERGRGGPLAGACLCGWGLAICGVGGSTAKSKKQKVYITHGMFVFPIYFVLPTWGVGISSLC